MTIPRVALFASILFFSVQATKAAILLPGGSPDPSFSGIKAWYDAGSIGVGDGNPVDSWESSAATANTATALLSSRRPTLITSGLGGLPAVAFDGVDDQLRMATSYFTGWPPLELTIFAVLQTMDTSAHVIGTGSSGAGYLESYGYGLVIDESPTLKANFTSNGVYLQATTTDLSNGGLVTSIASNTGSTIAIDGLLEATSVNSLNPYYSYAQATLGASDGSNGGHARDPFAGSISEILIYGSLTPTEIDQVNDYLMDKYFVVPEPSTFLLAIFAITAFCLVAVRRSLSASPISFYRRWLDATCWRPRRGVRQLLRSNSRSLISFVRLSTILLALAVSCVASADIVTFESGYSEADAVTSIVTATNEIAVSTDSGPGAFAVQTGTAAYAFGSVFGPDSVRPDLAPLVGSYFLTDENIGSPTITASFLFVFDQPITDLSLAVLDLEGTATLTVFSDAAMTTTVGTHSLTNFEDGDVDILSVLTPSADILAARLWTDDFGIGVDNIAFETAPEPSSFLLAAFGAIALCFAAIRRRRSP